MRNCLSTQPAVMNFTATSTVMTVCKNMLLNWKKAMSIFLLVAFLFSANSVSAQSFGKDFRQGANNDNPYPLGTLHWINSILQSSNSVYVEGMSTPQRVIFDALANCNTDSKHQLRIKLQANKSGNHAYDFLTSWDQAFAAAAAVAPVMVLCHRIVQQPVR